MVDQDQVGAAGIGGGLDLFQLSAADQYRGVGAIDPCGQRRRHAGTCGAGKVGEFLQQALVGRTAGVGLDQQGVFALAGTFKQGRRSLDGDSA